jgi:hypothetical protein
MARWPPFTQNILTITPIEQRIAGMSKAHSGEKPKQIVIEQSRTEKFVDHSPPSVRHTSISRLLESAVANCDHLLC